MQRLFSTFPAGAPGAGLLLFRLALAIALLTDVPQLFAADLQTYTLAACITLAGLLALGLLTPLAAVAGAGVAVACALTCLHPDLTRDLTQAALMLSLALIGAGAYSIDARLYGRRHIIVPRQHDR